jgi:hypothetical protein
MSKFTETRLQLEARVEANDEWPILPKGDEGKYVKWLKNTSDAQQYARMMALLQRTQELGLNEWRELRERAYERFGKDLYKSLLAQRHRETPVLPPNPGPTFARKQVMFGALMEEKHEITPEWQGELKEKYESIRTGETLYRIRNLDKEATKMKLQKWGLAGTKRFKKWNERSWYRAFIGGRGTMMGDVPRRIRFGAQHGRRLKIRLERRHTRFAKAWLFSRSWWHSGIGLRG